MGFSTTQVSGIHGGGLEAPPQSIDKFGRQAFIEKELKFRVKSLFNVIHLFAFQPVFAKHLLCG